MDNEVPAAAEFEPPEADDGKGRKRDPEIDAMARITRTFETLTPEQRDKVHGSLNKIVRAMDGLTPDARLRIIAWSLSKFCGKA